jgi:predicted metal-binding membrane protein
MTIGLLWSLLGNRRAVVCGALAAVIVAAWAYLWLGARVEMETMETGGGRTMAMPPDWTLPHALLIFVMWVVMMAAMMLPGAAPTVLSVAVLAQGRLVSSIPAPATAMLFAAGYLLVWVWVQPRRYLSAMGSRRSRAVIRDDGVRQ